MCYATLNQSGGENWTSSGWKYYARRQSHVNYSHNFRRKLQPSILRTAFLLLPFALLPLLFRFSPPPGFAAVDLWIKIICNLLLLLAQPSSLPPHIWGLLLVGRSSVCCSSCSSRPDLPTCAQYSNSSWRRWWICTCWWSTPCWCRGRRGPGEEGGRRGRRIPQRGIPGFPKTRKRPTAQLYCHGMDHWKVILVWTLFDQSVRWDLQ